MKELLKAAIDASAAGENLVWIKENIETITGPADFYRVFAQIPRKVGKSLVQFDTALDAALTAAMPGFTVEGWTLERICRVYSLLHLDTFDREVYIKTIENLFLTAELNELVAVYSALPVLAWPESWIKRCAEGIRSNMAPVLEAILYRNPYPALHLDIPAWNQLVLKAFFTEKDLRRIEGLDARNNPDLARMLVEYARERHAAGRQVDPVLWRLAGPFAAPAWMSDFSRVMDRGTDLERLYLASGIFRSDYEPARILVSEAGFLPAAGALTGDPLS